MIKSLKYEFANYCIRKKICKEKKDAHLVFIRLNRDRDGGLQTKELKNELIKPYSYQSAISTSCYS